MTNLGPIPFPYVNLAELIWGPALLGFCVSLSLYGVTLAQTIFYFRTYASDNLKYKLMVAIVSILDTAHVVFLFHSFWHMTIPGKFSPLLLGYVPWGLVASVIATYILTFIVQCFYGIRVWQLSQRNVYIATSMGILIVVQLVSGMIFASQELATMKKMLTPGAFANPAALITELVSSVLCDVLITGSMVYYLNLVRTGVKNTERLIQNLIILSVNMGMIGCLMALVQLLTFLLKRHSFMFAAPHIICSKLYVNSLLATLNSRNMMREQARNNHINYYTPGASEGIEMEVSQRGLKTRSIHAFEKHSCTESLGVVREECQ